jgi:tetratricopeptide (TPR) repeat protein
MNPAYLLLLAIAVEITVDNYKQGPNIPYENQMTYAGRKSQRWFFNNYMGAERNYTNAIKIDSTNYRAYYRRGQLRQRRKYCFPELARQDLQKALNIINKDIKRNPTDSLYWIRGHIKLSLTEDMIDACEDFTKAGELGSTSYKYYCEEKKP